MRTVEMQVTTQDIRSTFGNIIDYVIVEAAGFVEGWTHYDIISYNRDVFGYRTWEIDLNREDEDNTTTIANVHIQYYGMTDDTPDNEVVADVSINIL